MPKWRDSIPFDRRGTGRCGRVSAARVGGRSVAPRAGGRGARPGLVACALVAAGLGGASPAAAESGWGLPSVEVHGFVSPGFLVTTKNNYLARSKRGSFEFSEVGINFTVPLSDRLRAGVQLFARDLGPTGNFDAKFDWYYLDYRFADWVGVRAGRVKLPFGLYNETNDIDVARVPVLLPQSVYPVQNRDFLLAHTGVELYGRADMASLGALESRFYAGTIYLDTQSQTSFTTVQQIDVPYVVGQRLFWETPVEGLRGGVSLLALRLDAKLRYQDADVRLSLPAVLAVASAEYALRDWLFSAEYSLWRVTQKVEGIDLPTPPQVVSERAYAMASYHATPWLQPGVYYSVLFPDRRDRSGRESVQHDAALTLRFDVTSHWLVKLEGHYMNGTAGLRSELNGGRPLDALARSWGALMVKTTAYF